MSSDPGTLQNSDFNPVAALNVANVSDFISTIIRPEIDAQVG